METRHVQTVLVIGAKCGIGDCWLMSEVLQCVAVTSMRPDIVLYIDILSMLCLIYTVMSFFIGCRAFFHSGRGTANGN